MERNKTMKTEITAWRRFLSGSAVLSVLFFAAPPPAVVWAAESETETTTDTKTEDHTTTTTTTTTTTQKDGDTTQTTTKTDTSTSVRNDGTVEQTADGVKINAEASEQRDSSVNTERTNAGEDDMGGTELSGGQTVKDWEGNILNASDSAKGEYGEASY